ncbi:MEDS domain-containing protein [Streptomyces guryensis]|uniref:MEDS domain-containing protein n=1 Tax=Streptomyces guryensis TaxID=2886947 RepID=A0A9Q3VK18_9ACTN|nr:MEDS domain-containing protein [Streptomyces guryensis]MCD9873616.1 MEDS domain-containing protein [Streptomyces guryensis]
MTSTHHGPTPTPFDHRMAVYGADDEFVAAALPFLVEGLGAPGEPPPVAIAAPDKLDLLRDALGGDASSVTFVPHTEWYTGSAANAVAQGAGYLAAHAGPGGRIHLLMEPVWNGRAGRSVRETTEWIRYEALANLLFAPLATTALCAYDTRTAGAAIIEAARRAHPDTAVYEDPVRLTAELDSVPLSLPPAAAEPLARPYPEAVRAGAAARGLAPADAELFAEAVTAAATALGSVTDALMWGRAPACVCELRAPHRLDDPLAGFVPPPTPELEPDQGLWFTRQVCAYVDVRDEGAGTTVRLQYG